MKVLGTCTVQEIAHDGRLDFKNLIKVKFNIGK